MCDKMKTWLVIDDRRRSQVCRTVKELEDLLLGDCGEAIGDITTLSDTIEEVHFDDDWTVYEISGSEATKVDIQFEMKLSIRL